jgi:hypothetical protein
VLIVGDRANAGADQQSKRGYQTKAFWQVHEACLPDCLVRNDTRAVTGRL